MEQRKLYRTIENFMHKAPNFETSEELLCYVIEQIINTDSIEITGGRLWKLNSTKTAYYLLEQMGDVQIIDKGYELKIYEFPVFKEVGFRRAYMGLETNKYLQGKGIYNYSAAGIGDRYKIKESENSTEPYYLYNYVMALNGKKLDNDFLNTLNIISVTVSSILKTKKIESKAKENLEELEKASEIQKSILPEHELNFGNYEIFGISIPEKIVGGDFFDYLTTAEDYKMSIAIGDAASKGISAAAQALYVSGALKMGSSYDISMTSLIRKINKLVYNTFPFERFVTLFYCELYNDKRGLCVFVNAGHNNPYQFIKKTDKIFTLGTTGSVLGPSPATEFTTESTNLDIDDVLVLYTDGIVEAADSNFNFYGEDRLKELIIKHSNLSAKNICTKILDDVQSFNAKGKYSDDKTLVVIKRVK